MKFRVVLTKQATWQEAIEVEADTQEQAESNALGQASNINFSDYIDSEYSVFEIRKVAE